MKGSRELELLFYTLGKRIIKLKQYLYRNERNPILTDSNRSSIEQVLVQLRNKRDELRGFIRTNEIDSFIKNSTHALELITKNQFQKSISNFIPNETLDLEFLEQVSSGKTISIRGSYQLKSKKASKKERAKYERIIIKDETSTNSKQNLVEKEQENYETIFEL